MKRVEFRLSMPSRGSWDGGWSGAYRNYTIIRPLPDAKAVELVAGGPYYHFWSDGWTARISVRVLDRGERPAKSAGFSGYDWMVTNLIRHGDTADPTPALLASTP